jgi:LmbE family N-acetylglucosaminyl deacetylase
MPSELSAAGAPPSLEPFPEDWSRALAVVAHPDDLEYGAASAIARWTGEGREVAYVLVTRGEAGIDNLAPEEAGPLREAEERAGAALVGVEVVEFLDHADGIVEYGLDLRRDLAAAIRRHRPELLITLNHHDSWGPGSPPNMADHRNVGRGLIDATRDARNRWVFTDQLTDGLEPWSGVRWVAVSGSPLATHAVDVGATLERGIASLQAHRAYLAGLAEGTTGTDPARFLREAAITTGERFDGRPAVAFELIPL